jgi:hypothetical protein
VQGLAHRARRVGGVVVLHGALGALVVRVGLAVV